jgi:DNA-binding beta-propeller fold protein YncE
VRKAAQTEVDGPAEGLAVSPDGRYLYVGNFIDGNIDILRPDSDALTKVGRPPCSMRGSSP